MGVEGGRGTRTDMLCRRRTAEEKGRGGWMCSPNTAAVLTLNCLTLRAPLPSKTVSHIPRLYYHECPIYTQY